MAKLHGKAIQKTKAIRMLEQTSADELSVKRIAELTGLSYPTVKKLSDIYRKGDFTKLSSLQEKKREAAYLLENTSMSQARIWKMVGLSKDAVMRMAKIYRPKGDLVVPDIPPKRTRQNLTPETKEQMTARIMELIEEGGRNKKDIADALGIAPHIVYKLSKGAETSAPSKAVVQLTDYEQAVLLGKEESDGSPRIQTLQKILELLLENRYPLRAIAEQLDIQYPLVLLIHSFAQEQLGYKRERALLEGVDNRRKQNRMTREWLIEQRFEKGLSMQAIGEQLGVTRERVRQLLARHGLNGRVALNRQMPKEEAFTPMNHSYFDSITTEEQAYWLGLLVARAQPKYLTDEQLLVGFSFRFSHQLRPLVEQMMEALEIQVDITSHSTVLPNGGTTEWNNIEVIAPQIGQQLVRHGMKNPKFSEMHLPQELGPELIRHFLRAYYEQRGSVTAHKTYFLFALGGSKQLLENFISIMKEEGVEYPPGSLRFVGKEKFHRIRLTGIHKICDTLNYLYHDSTVSYQPKVEEKEWFDGQYDETMAALDEKKKVREEARQEASQKISNKAPKSPNKQVYSKLKHANASRDTPINVSYFENIQTEAQAYWMGYMMNRFIVQRHLKNAPAVRLSYRPELAEHFNAFYRDAEAQPRMSTQKGAYKEPDRLMHVAHIRSVPFIQSLDKLGLSSRDWNDIPFPSHLSDELTVHFLRGYFDSRAFLKKTVTAKRTFVVGGGRSFLLEMAEFLRGQGIDIPQKAVSKREESRKQSRLELGSAKKIKDLAVLLYNEATIYVPEKTHGFNQFFGDGES